MTEPELEPAAEESDVTEYEDVDDVIGIAAEMMREDEGRLDEQELDAVGRELDIPPEYLDRARVELARRRVAEVRLEEQTQARRKRVGMIAALVVALSTILAVTSYSSTASALRERHGDVQARAAQVDNVRARKLAVEQQLADRPASPDKDAELVGAENRIRVETKRYVEAATAYNEAAAGWFASWSASVAGLPAQVPLTPIPDP
jgi:hypothetical protein